MKENPVPNTAMIEMRFPSWPVRIQGTTSVLGRVPFPDLLPEQYGSLASAALTGNESISGTPKAAGR